MKKPDTQTPRLEVVRYVRITPALDAEVIKVADADERTVSYVLRKAIEQYVRRRGGVA